MARNRLINGQTNFVKIYILIQVSKFRDEHDIVKSNILFFRSWETSKYGSRGRVSGIFFEKNPALMERSYTTVVESPAYLGRCKLSVNAFG